MTGKHFQDDITLMLQLGPNSRREDLRVKAIVEHLAPH